uniref:Uncharacterized protein n=1 Tax=Rhizophora mucronata TaxID=61149 RepID=A0A2P2QNZ7_RHIMU
MNYKDCLGFLFASGWESRTHGLHIFANLPAKYM